MSDSPLAEIDLCISVPMPDDLDENDAELATAIAREFVRIVNEERKRNNYMTDSPVELVGVARWVSQTYGEITVHFKDGPWDGQTVGVEQVTAPVFAVGHKIGNHYWLDTKSDPPTYHWADER